MKEPRHEGPPAFGFPRPAYAFALSQAAFAMGASAFASVRLGAGPFIVAPRIGARARVLALF